MLMVGISGQPWLQLLTDAVPFAVLGEGEPRAKSSHVACRSFAQTLSQHPMAGPDFNSLLQCYAIEVGPARSSSVCWACS